MSNISEIGISSLLANQYALTVISQNIANANTPYYSRRVAEFAENAFNHGVSIADVRRVVDETANKNVQTAQSGFSQADLYLQQLLGLETSVDDRTTSIGSKITDSLSALERLNTDVTSMQNRGLYLSALNAISSRFQSLHGELDQEVQNSNLSLGNDMGQINNLLSSIANVNNQLVGMNQNTAELLDKRQGLVNELAKYLNFTAMVDNQGMMSINLSNGMALVSGRQALQMKTLQDPQNPSSLLIGLQSSSTTIPITQFISGGELSALITYRDNVVAPAQRALDRLSLAMADAFNKQNKLGIDSSGNLGGNIINDINNANLVNNRVLSHSANTGSGGFTVNITDPNLLTTSDYKLSIGASNAYVLTRISDNKVMSSGTIPGSGSLPFVINSADGFSVSINSGTFNAGDQYVVSPTRGGANNFGLMSTDPSKLALGWPVTASIGTQKQGSTGKVNVTSITDTTTSAFSVPKQLTPPITIHFLSATSYEIINATTSTVMSGPYVYNSATGANVFPAGAYDPGYRVFLSGTIQADDTFNIAYNTSSGDNSNGLAMAKIYQKGMIENGTFTMNQGYDALANDISIEANKAQSSYDVANALKTQADMYRDQISGVSLPEETMSLSQYQQSYQASAQILQIAKSILETIMSMARG